MNVWPFGCVEASQEKGIKQSALQQANIRVLLFGKAVYVFKKVSQG